MLFPTASIVAAGGPEEAAENNRAQGVWTDERVDDFVRRRWPLIGDRVALRDHERCLTYSELDALCDSTSAGLVEIGIGLGDHVIIQMDNSADFVIGYLALLSVGAIPVLTLPAHRERELISIAHRISPKAIICPASYRGHDHETMAHQVAQNARIDTVIVSGDPAEVDSVPFSGLANAVTGATSVRALVSPAKHAHVLLSGGTSGLPKLIGRTHNDYVFNIRRSAEVCGFDNSTRYLAVLPAAHNFTLGCPGILGVLTVGGTAILTNRTHPAALMRSVADFAPTVTSVVPTVLSRWTQWCEASAQTSPFLSLSMIQVGGALLAPELSERAHNALGCSIQHVFGMAEGLLCFPSRSDVASSDREPCVEPMSMHDEISVRDAEGRVLPDGVAGELYTRGPYTIRGYYGPDAAKTGEGFTDDGWYRTGDLVTRWGNHLSVRGRVKDVINRGGEKVSTREVEDLAAAITDIAETAAIGIPDSQLGERVCLVVRTDCTDRSTIVDRVRTEFSGASLAEYKKPDIVCIVDEFPHTAVGKVDKVTLAAQVATTPTYSLAGHIDD